VGLTSIYLICPTLVVQAAGGSADVAAAVVSMALVALAIGAILQAIPMGPVGSGYLCKPDTSVLYFVPSLIAAKHAGLAAVFGMTIAAGLFEVAGAHPGPMRALLPEIAGLVVLLAGCPRHGRLRTALAAGNANVPSMNDLGIALTGW
jgi:NCS2 family nucleobase:cation symporter-2